MVFFRRGLLGGCACARLMSSAGGYPWQGVQPEGRDSLMSRQHRQCPTRRNAWRPGCGASGTRRLMAANRRPARRVPSSGTCNWLSTLTNGRRCGCGSGARRSSARPWGRSENPQAETLHRGATLGTVSSRPRGDVQFSAIRCRPGLSVGKPLLASASRPCIVGERILVHRRTGGLMVAVVAAAEPVIWRSRGLAPSRRLSCPAVNTSADGDDHCVVRFVWRVSATWRRC